MRQLLILLTVVGFVFAQTTEEEVSNPKSPWNFELTPELQEKLEAAKAKVTEMLNQFKTMDTENKQAYFEKMREQAKTKIEAKLAALNPEQKADIETKIAAIKDKFNKKNTKMMGFKKGKKCNKKELSEEQIAELKAKKEQMKAKWKTKKGKKNDLRERDYKDFKKLFPFFGDKEEKCKDPNGCVTPD